MIGGCALRIVQVSSGLHKEFGGPPVAVLGAASGLRNLGHQVQLFVFGQSTMSRRDNAYFLDKLAEVGVEVYFSKSKKTSRYGGIGSVADLVEILRVIAKSDIVICHQLYNFQNAIVVPLARILNKPVVLMPHGTLTAYQRSKIGMKKRLLSPYFEYLINNFTTGIFVATKKELIELTPRLKQKATVVGLGLEEIETLGSERQATECFNFLYLGRITSKKRIDVALDSFAKLTKITTRKIHFNICGSGDEIIIEDIKEKIRDLALDNCVSFLGWKTGKEKIEILRNSDCFILTSEDENFAIAVAESLQYGIPSIISKQVALSQVVEEYGAGLVFKDLDSNEISKIMLEMIQLDQEMLRKSALRASEQFSWEKISIIWSDSLKELLKKRA